MYTLAPVVLIQTTNVSCQSTNKQPPTSHQLTLPLKLLHSHGIAMKRTEDSHQQQQQNIHMYVCKAKIM